MPETYVITGGAGNLACQVTFELAARDRRVVLADVAPRPVAAVAPGSLYVRCDLTDAAAVRELLREHRPTAVLHFASLLSGRSEEDRRGAWRLNLDATFELFETMLELGVGRMLFPSSVAAYGGSLPNPLPEDYPQWPAGLYGVTKAAVERLGVYYAERHGLDFRALRVPIVLSPHAPLGAASAYVSQSFIQAFRQGAFTFRVRPQTRPAVIYTKDIVRGLADLLEAPAEKLTRRVYNVHALAPAAAELAAAIAARLPQARLDFKPDETVVRLIEGWPSEIADASARRDWGWQPRFDLPALADDFLQELARDAAVAPGL